MKIALIAPVEETIPPTKYGGIEWIVYDLAHGLGKRGHAVDVYASGDSKKESSYRLIPTLLYHFRNPTTQSDDLRTRELKKLFHVATTLTRIQQHSYDIIHNHFGARIVAFAPFFSTPLVTTHHIPINDPLEQDIFRTYKYLPSISISNHQRLDCPELHYSETIYNGVNTTDLPFYTHPDTHMLFFARLSPEKGPALAAKVAKKMAIPLVVGGKIDSVDQQYVTEQFMPFVDNALVTYIGEIASKEKAYYYQKAKVLLSPTSWEEPFGLMFIESMSCGTPVIAFARGAVPEIIEDGKTGFIVNFSDTDIRGNWIVKQTGFAGLCEAVKRLYALSPTAYQTMRKNCRAHVEKKFSVQTMVKKYEEVYIKILRNIL